MESQTWKTALSIKTDEESLREMREWFSRRPVEFTYVQIRLKYGASR
jgi:hypothetical protein